MLHDAPMFQARASSYLLASLIDVFPTDVVFLCVVDPGVGGSRAPAVVEADGRRFVGPDNGLFEILLRRANNTSFRRITWNRKTCRRVFMGATCLPRLPPTWQKAKKYSQNLVPSTKRDVPTGPTSWKKSSIWTISETR